MYKYIQKVVQINYTQLNIPLGVGWDPYNSSGGAAQSRIKNRRPTAI